MYNDESQGAAGPLVSVILPVYNAGPFLKEALASVSAQYHPNLELIAVDDGSTDGSGQYLELFCRQCPIAMKVVRHPERKNRGIAASYQLGIEACRGSFVAFIEQDDFWPPNKLSEQLTVFEKFPEVGLVFSDVFPCDWNGKPTSEPLQGFLNRPPRDKPFRGFSRLLWGNYVLTFSNIMARRELIRSSYIIAEPPGYQDWMLLILLSAHCQFYHCSDTQTYWREHRDSFYNHFRNQREYPAMRRKYRQEILEKAIGLRQREGISSPAGRRKRKRMPFLLWRAMIFVLNMAEEIVRRVRPGFDMPHA